MIGTATMAAAYGAGERFLSRLPSTELLRGQIETFTHANFVAVEKAYQTRVDEEGCGAFMSAAIYGIGMFHVTSDMDGDIRVTESDMPLFKSL